MIEGAPRTRWNPREPLTHETAFARFAPMFRHWMRAPAVVVCACLLCQCETRSANAGSPPVLDAGADGKCRRVQFVASPAGCRAAWACTGSTLFALTCVTKETGTTCICTTDSDAGPTASMVADACSDAGITPTAKAVCGWNL